MMRGVALLIALAAVGTTGCTGLLHRDRGDDPQEQLQAGVQALAMEDWTRARGFLEPLYHERWGEPVGQQALLLLTAAELNPRNPDRRLWAAADRSARLLNIPELPRWMVPVAESFYLLANELGAHEEQIARADSARGAAEQRVAALSGRTLPGLRSETVPARERKLREERDAARRSAEQLQQTLAARDKQLKETREELERIKRTIRS